MKPITFELGELSEPFEKYCRRYFFSTKEKGEFIRNALAAVLNVENTNSSDTVTPVPTRRLYIRVSEEGYERMQHAMSLVGMKTPSHYFEFMTRQTLHEFSVPMKEAKASVDSELLKVVLQSNLELVRLNNRLNRVIERLKEQGEFNAPLDQVVLESIEPRIKVHIKAVHSMLATVVPARRTMAAKPKKRREVK